MVLVGVRDTLLVAALAYARIIKQPINTLPIIRQHPKPPVINRRIHLAFHNARPQDLSVDLRVQGRPQSKFRVYGLGLRA